VSARAELCSPATPPLIEEPSREPAECRAKVAALETGRAQDSGVEEGSLNPWGVLMLVGKCPRCDSILVGEATQLDFEGYDADEDRWSDVVRVFPKPPKAFASYRIPRGVKDSLLAADRSLQGNANIAACVMFGRALEGICQNVLDDGVDGSQAKTESS